MLLAGGFGVVKGIGLLSGDSDEQIAEGSGPGDDDVGVDVTQPASTAPPEGIAAPTSRPRPRPRRRRRRPRPVVPPSAEHPAKVLVVGDSDAGTFGPYLKELLDEHRRRRDDRRLQGVVRAGPSRLLRLAGAPRPDAPRGRAPDIVVVTFGGNDAQGLSTADGSNPTEWNDPVTKRDTWLVEYAKRAGAVMDHAGGRRAHGGVGRDPQRRQPRGHARAWRSRTTASRRPSPTRPDVQFVDTWTLFSSGNGGWAEYAIDPRDGQGKDVRAADGFHLNENGAEILAVRDRRRHQGRPPRPTAPRSDLVLGPDPGRERDQESGPKTGFPGFRQHRGRRTPMGAWVGRRRPPCARGGRCCRGRSRRPGSATS